MGNYLTFSSPSTFTLNIVDNTKHWNGTLEYSTDTQTWNEWSGTSAISSSADGKLYIRGTGNTYITGSSTNFKKAYWVLTGGNISCNGNIENLLDYQTVANNEHPVMFASCYESMFYGCTSLITAPELPATTLKVSCYESMFYGCTSLITAPELPATTLAKSCYHNMFTDCISLTTAPVLPATTLDYYCYYGMFNGCTSLTTAPDLSATTLYVHCYQLMFFNCISLTTAPELPATTLADYCYYGMFMGCTNIKLSTTQTDEYQKAYRIPISGTGTTGTNALTDMFRTTGGTFTGTPEINTTYYTTGGVWENEHKIIIKNPVAVVFVEEEESPTAPTAPTDLTGYTVEVPANWSASAGFGVFNLFGTITNLSSNTTRILSNVITENFKIGYNSSSTIANQLVYINDYGSIYGASKVDSFILYITGGNDATNQNLIQWLANNNATFTYSVQGGGN